MILYRYISREILTTTLAVSSVLLLIILGSRFARYLGRAASGKLSLDSLGQLTLLYMPYAAQMLLPLSFVLAVMLTFGRLYMENEMAVIQSAGISQRRLLLLVLFLSLGIAGLTAFSSLYLTPWTQELSQKVIQKQQERTGFESISAGQFMTLGEQVVHAQGLSDDQQSLTQVFILKRTNQGEELLFASRGFQQLAEATRSRFLILENGLRYELPRADNLTSSELTFERYALRLATQRPLRLSEEVEALPLTALLKRKDKAAQVELQWRLGLPAMLVIMVLVAFPLTRIKPRQGRFMAILPVLFLQMVFLTSLMSLQDTINKDQWPLYPGLWAVHLIFLGLGLTLCWRRGVLGR